MKYSIRERYLWQLLFPDPNDQFYIEQPGQFRAELHDRLIAPFYPLAFAVIAFAYLGAPRTTRQSRTMSMLGAIGGVALLRLTGFVSTVFGATVPWMLSLQYVALVAAFGGGLFVIRRGLILEPPAFIANWLAALTERIMPTLRDAMSSHADHRRNTWRVISAALPERGAAGVRRHFRAGRAARLHRVDAPRQRHPARLGDPGGEDLVLPRAAGDRAHHAVLRADRRHVLLPQSVAAARTGGRALGRHVGLAIHLAGAGRGLRCSASSPPRSTIRSRPSCRSAPSATRPSCSADKSRGCTAAARSG